MTNDAFSKSHPAVNFLFFAAVMVFTVIFLHPVYLVSGCVCAALYYLLLKGRKALKTMLGLLPIFLILTAINPLFNTAGEHILFYVFGRPYTLEALLYGGAIAGVFVGMMLWFGCYNAVMTGDKFSALFGAIIPSVSLVLVMILRMVPNLLGKTRQISGARAGLGMKKSRTFRRKLSEGMSVLSCLTDWALEGGIVTADSMRSRGYGSKKRTSFQIYRFTLSDGILIAATILLCIGTALHPASAAFIPRFQAAPIGPGFFCYCALCLIPTILYLWEALKWHISKSKI